MDSIQTGNNIGEALKLEGALNFSTMPKLLADSSAYSLQENLPDCLAIDFSDVTDIDSSAVALLLHWRRAAMRMGKRLRYIHLPPNLLSLAELYGLDELIICPTQDIPCPSGE